MNPKRFYWIVVALLALAVVLAACQAEPETVEVTRVVTEVQEVEKEVPVEVEVEVTRVVTEVTTETVTEVVEVEQAQPGTEERPIKVLFVPSVEVDQVIAGGEIMAQALEDATGLKFEVSVPTSYGATIEEICASPDDTIAFLATLAYVIANDTCGVTVGVAADRRGLSWYTTQFVVPMDSDIETLEDLAGKTWAIPEFTSTSGYLYPFAMLAELGVEPGEIVEAGGHNGAMLAVYNGEADFATGFFSPPTLPYDERTWTYGVDDPEIWREAGESPVLADDGRTYVAGGPDEGGYRIGDARTLVNDTVPDIFDKTRIVGLSGQIPNDTISFGPEFPLALSSDIIDAMVAFTASEACLESICSDEFYDWSGLTPVSDSFYDPVRVLMEVHGMSPENILGGG